MKKKISTWLQKHKLYDRIFNGLLRLVLKNSQFVKNLKQNGKKPFENSIVSVKYLLLYLFLFFKYIHCPVLSVKIYRTVFSKRSANKIFDKQI